jgi:hypothetical protein
MQELFIQGAQESLRINPEAANETALSPGKAKAPRTGLNLTKFGAPPQPVACFPHRISYG